jgi:hypothetical protein
MAITYEQYTSITGNDFIRRNNEDGSFSDIPMVEGNSDYQAYLAEQSTPMVTDEASTL